MQPLWDRKVIMDTTLLEPHTETGNLMLDPPSQTVIKALGLGGGGSNAIDRMIQVGISGVEFIAANTDAQALQSNDAPTKILLGSHSTRGLGTGGQAEIGKRAADESRDEITASLQGADMVFLSCGMGGGTGTGAIPVVADIARDIGAVTIAVVTTPFSFEGSSRYRNAMSGIECLQGRCDTLITVPNDRLLQIVPKDIPLDVAFRMADDALRQGVQGIAELITRPGLINLDFANIRNLLKQPGGAVLAIGQGKGEGKAMEAVRQALKHPLHDIAGFEQATGVLVHFTGSSDLTLFEIGRAMDEIRRAAPDEAEVMLGASFEEQMTGRAQLIMIATGVGGHSLEETLSNIPDTLHSDNSRYTFVPAKNDSPFVNSRHASPEGATTSGQFAPEKSELDNILPMSGLPPNIDVPAFMRRRRITGSDKSIGNNKVPE